MSGSGSGFAQFIPLILIFVIFYFFLIRPQQKRAKDHKAMVAAIKRGDEVVTSGGIVGKVERILGEDKLDLSISENVTVQVVQSTIQSILNKPDAKKIIIFCVIFFKTKNNLYIFINIFSIIFYNFKFFISKL